MWKRREEAIDDPASPANHTSAYAGTEVPAVSAMLQSPELKVAMGHDDPRAAVAHIGQSIVIRGELIGSEDMYIDGQVEGTIELKDHDLTVGPYGRVQANVNAKGAVILGSIKGNVRALDRIEIGKSGSVVGDLVATRFVIEDGAYFKGSIDIQKTAESTVKLGEPKRVDSLPIGEKPSKFAAEGTKLR